ncbi:MAG: thymidine phosphorylase [Halieaceae bacterium]|jgi:thymidine phosphorylase
MLVQDIIRRKRDGESLEPAEIQALVRGIVDQSMSEGQIASFAMATFFQGMSNSECAVLTREMKQSGATLNWTEMSLPGPIVDKHSTGGVGDKVSLILAPMLAACGVFVPMISGRGLGHTGGTVDKMESIPGYQSQPEEIRLQAIVAEVGCAIVGQTSNLAPADKRFYAVRDVTATVESIPLITASILSKKLSAGLDSLVMDVKTGSGAFATSREMARDLARNIIAVGAELGLPISALITDMGRVLGRSAGNSLEVLESVQFLTGDFHDQRLRDVVTSLGAELLVLSGVDSTLQAGHDRMDNTLSNGSAAERFGRMVAALGGPSDFVEKPSNYLAVAAERIAVYPEKQGIVTAIDARSVGYAVVELGGGRRIATDKLDFSVGLAAVKAPGESVGPSEPLAIIYAANKEAAAQAAARLRQAFSIGDSAGPPAEPVILNQSSNDGNEHES